LSELVHITIDFINYKTAAIVLSHSSPWNGCHKELMMMMILKMRRQNG